MATSVLIVGGGFGGISAAHAFARLGKDVSVRLLDPKSHFEYHAALYRFVTGAPVAETCIPYASICTEHNIEVVRDAADICDLSTKTVTGASGARYRYDTLILALGSETATFGIPGVDRHAFGMKTGNEAMKLKRHIDENCEHMMNIVIVGGGATGVELSGELGAYARKLRSEKGWTSATTRVTLVEAGERLLPNLPERASALAQKRLQALGVDVCLGQTLKCEREEGITLNDRSIKAQTVIWTAGMSGHGLLRKISGLTLDRKGRVIVNRQLQPAGHEDVFVIGDAAATERSGMAQTALYDGEFAANAWSASRNRKPAPSYRPPVPIVAIPIGRGWAIAIVNNRLWTGRTGWMIRRLLDLKVFLSMMPAMRALAAFFGR